MVIIIFSYLALPAIFIPIATKEKFIGKFPFFPNSISLLWYKKWILKNWIYLIVTHYQAVYYITLSEGDKVSVFAVQTFREKVLIFFYKYHALHH